MTTARRLRRFARPVVMPWVVSVAVLGAVLVLFPRDENMFGVGYTADSAPWLEATVQPTHSAEEWPGRSLVLVVFPRGGAGDAGDQQWGDAAWGLGVRSLDHGDHRVILTTLSLWCLTPVPLLWSAAWVAGRVRRGRPTGGGADA